MRPPRIIKRTQINLPSITVTEVENEDEFETEDDTEVEDEVEIEGGAEIEDEVENEDEDENEDEEEGQNKDEELIIDRSVPAVNLSESSTTIESTITREMSVVEILEHLGRHGCEDVTNYLDTSKCSEYPISSGGYGDVYRGALREGSRVAVKCLRLHMDSTDDAKRELKRAARELYVWSKCSHSNVLGLIGVAQYRNQIAMVSPWMEYGNILRLLSLRPDVDRYALCTQVADGVGYLHSVGVIHGDLKGDNVLASDDLTPKLTDFGNASLKEYTLRFSKTTSKAGLSVNWVAPEVLKEETGLTTEADVWSLGMTILEIVTGEIPYSGMREFAVMRRIERNEHPARAEVHIPSRTRHGDLLWSLLTECWESVPQDRPDPIQVRDKMGSVVLERDNQNCDDAVGDATSPVES